MGHERVEPATAGTETRRSRRESDPATPPRGLSTGPGLGTGSILSIAAAISTGTERVTPSAMRRWIPRVALLCTLSVFTIVLPLTDNITTGNGTFASGAMAAGANAPRTFDVLISADEGKVPPPAITTASRGGASTSRSEVRTLLPGCDDAARPAGANGQLATKDLCQLWDGSHTLRGDAAGSLAELDLAFKARFGRDLCIAQGYRTLAEQRVLKATKGGLAAVPGRSNHGWGLAVDLCSNETSGAGYTWIKENGAAYGWANPAWALAGGSGPHEPWHWEYTRGVLADGQYYTS